MSEKTPRMSETTRASIGGQENARDGLSAASFGFIRNIGLYVYVFYVVYTPTFSTSFFASKFFILAFLAVVVVLHSAMSNFRQLRLLAYKPLARLLITVFLLSLFVAFVRIATSPDVADFADLRIVQNNVILLMAIHAAFILHIFKRRGFTAEASLQVLYKLAAFQGVWGLLSFVFPVLKDVSNGLYELAAGEREFVVAVRVYGFMGEYTFVTPIYHGMLAAVAIYFALNYRYRGLRYVPLILVAILLNGRTGIAVFAAMVAVILLRQVLRGRSAAAAVGIVAALGAVLWIAWSLVSQLSPGTARFLQTFIDDTNALISDGSQQGNYAILLNEIFTVPDGFALLWGTGGDVYESNGGFRTDVGFTNDLFMGGLIFVVVGYGMLAYFLLKNSRPDVVLFGSLLLGFAIANLKGQIFVGTPVLFLFVFIVLLHHLIAREEMLPKLPGSRPPRSSVSKRI